MEHPLKTSIVRILSDEGAVCGGGFLVSDEYICTCYHVIFGDAIISRQKIQKKIILLNFVGLGDATIRKARVISWSAPTNLAGDIAVLKIIDPLPKAASGCSLHTFTRLHGSPVEVYGYPKGFPGGIWAEGALGQPMAAGWMAFTSREQHAVPLQHGFSGSPVWDIVRQAVVGMVVGVSLDPAQRVGFVIPNGHIADVSHELKISHPSTSYFGKGRFQAFVTAARLVSRSDDIVDYLHELSTSIEDGSQRYWLYLAICRIGGLRSQTIIGEIARTEVDPLARKAIRNSINKNF